MRGLRSPNMIEVTACLPRGPAFLAGETIQCAVTFIHSGTRESTGQQENGDRGTGCLAWASVQIHCQCSVSESRVHLPRSRVLSPEEVSATACVTRRLSPVKRKYHCQPPHVTHRLSPVKVGINIHLPQSWCCPQRKYQPPHVTRRLSPVKVGINIHTHSPSFVPSKGGYKYSPHPTVLVLSPKGVFATPCRFSPVKVGINITLHSPGFVPSKGERGFTVLATKPKILFCDLRLEPGDSKTYMFEDVIPSDAPPSFRGQAVKYSYKITIGTQHFKHPTKLLRIPFRVLVLYGLNDISVYQETDEVAPSNPFLKPQQEVSTVLDIALQVLSTVTARKTAHSYNITNAKGKVARFVLFKQAYKLGEDIIGMFEFSEGTVPCVQFSVTLQSEEQIAEECRKKASQGTAITSYVKHQEMCLHTQNTHISIPVPLTATPGFMTDIVCLRWRLHFEFVTACEPVTEPGRPSRPDESVTWRGPRPSMWRRWCGTSPSKSTPQTPSTPRASRY
ncbi:hypothetical protein ScPMuIL_018513 [Solemya velum]